MKLFANFLLAALLGVSAVGATLAADHAVEVAAPAKPAEPQTTGQVAPPAAAPAQAAAPAAVEAKPTPQIAPTQDMPKMQGLD